MTSTGFLLTLALAASGQTDATAPSPASPAPAAPVAPAAPKAERPRVLILDLEAVDVEPTRARAVNAVLTDALSQFASLELISQQDLRTLADLESERAVVGCDSTGCLAEIAAAMGATYVIFGTVSRLGEVTLVQLNLFDSEKATAVGRESAKSDRVEALAGALEAAAVRLVGGLVTPDERERAEARVAARAAASASEAAEATAEDGLSWPLLGGGGAAALVGVLLALTAVVGVVGANVALATPTLDGGTKTLAAAGGWAAAAGIVVGGAALAGGVALVGYAFIE